MVKRAAHSAARAPPVAGATGSPSPSGLVPPVAGGSTAECGGTLA